LIRQTVEEAVDVNRENLTFHLEKLRDRLLVA
jgi:hypothetical protein